MRNITLI